MLAQIPAANGVLIRLVATGKDILPPARLSRPTVAAGAFISQVTLYSRPWGVANCPGQPTDTRESPRACRTLREPWLATMAPRTAVPLIRPTRSYPRNRFFGSSRSRGLDFLLTVKANQRTLHRQIGEQFL